MITACAKAKESRVCFFFPFGNKTIFNYDTLSADYCNVQQFSQQEYKNVDKRVKIKKKIMQVVAKN